MKNGYPEHFINKYFKRFIDNIHVVKESTLTVEKNPPISLQTSTKLKKSLKTSLIVVNCKKCLKVRPD